MVTGGASGLGKGTVERFVKQGAKVVIADLPMSKGNELAKELGDNVIFTPMNVRTNICLPLFKLIISTDMFMSYF